MTVNILYEIVGSYPFTVDLDEYKDAIFDRYGKPWEDLLDWEKDDFMYDLGHELYLTAEAESEYGLGIAESWEDENYEQHDLTLLV